MTALEHAESRFKKAKKGKKKVAGTVEYFFRLFPWYHGEYVTCVV